MRPWVRLCGVRSALKLVELGSVLRFTRAREIAKIIRYQAWISSCAW